jgi:hypothetical protein
MRVPSPLKQRERSALLTQLEREEEERRSKKKKEEE